MRIAHFPSNFLPEVGGAEIVVHNLALQQHNRGHDVSVIAPSWRSWSVTTPYRIVPLIPSTLKHLVKRSHDSAVSRIVTMQLWLYQQFFRFDIWHIHMIYPAGVAACPMLRKSGIPSVATCHGSDIQVLPSIGYGLRLNPALDRMITESLKQYDVVTALNRNIRNQYLLLGIDAAKIRDIPNGIDFPRIQSTSANRSATRWQWSIPLDKFAILSVGRNHPVKGLDVIPRVIEKLAEQRVDFVWVVVGDGVEALSQKAESMGLGAFLRTIPRIVGDHAKPTDTRRTMTADWLHKLHRPTALADFPPGPLIRLYKACDLFVFPSLIESFGVAQIEAMSVGLPVVASDVPGCQDIVGHGKNGFLVPAGDVRGYAEQIAKLIESPHLLHEMGRNAVETARRFEWRDISAKYCEIYEELVGGHCDQEPR